MKYYGSFILKVITAIIACICFSSPVSMAYDQFTSNNIQFVNGGVKGELCSKSSSYFNEVFVIITALDSDGSEIWFEAIPIDGIGSKQCKDFFKPVSNFETPSKINFEYYTTPEENIFNIHDTHTEIYFDKFDVNGRELTGKVCNGSADTLKDILISVMGIKRDRTVLWKKDSIINILPLKGCQSISRHIDTIFLETPFFI